MKYSIRFFSLLLIAAIISLGCMQIAKNGISKVTSTDYYHVKDVVTIQKENGKEGAVLFGKDYTNKGLSIRQDHLERLGAFNYFSAAGKGVANFTAYITEKGIAILEKIPSIIHALQ